MFIVTGANGFIGSNLVRSLTLRAEAILHVDDYPALRGNSSPTDAVPAELRYEAHKVARYLDLHDLPRWLEEHGESSGIRGIFHLGACSDTTVTDRDYVMKRNFDYTRRLWAWCAAEDVPLIYASSAATYGDGSQGYDDQADPAIYRPLNLYGESKQRFDLWALEQRPGVGNSPPRWAGLKYFNVYGPRESHKGRMASVVFHAYNQIRATGKVKLFQSHREGVPDGGQQRDFVFVGDAVAMTLHLFDTPPSEDAAPNGLYNAGTGQARTFADLARATFAAMGREPDIEYIPMPEDLRGKYQYFTQADMEKLKRSGYTGPFRSIEEGVAAYVQWLRRPGTEAFGSGAAS